MGQPLYRLNGDAPGGTAVWMYECYLDPKTHDRLRALRGCECPGFTDTQLVEFLLDRVEGGPE